MFNTNVTNVLNQITPITNSAILKYPTTIFNSPAGDMLVSVNIESLDPTPFEDVGIYNLGEFLNTFKVFGEDRSVNISDKVFFIKEDEVSLEYISNSVSLLSAYDKPISIFETTLTVPTVAEFTLTSEDIRRIKQAAGVFKDLEDVVFTSKDGEIIISLSASNKFNAKSNKFSLNKTAETSKEFEVRIPTENFNVLPNSEYNFMVKYKEDKGAYRILMDSTELDDFQILMTVKK